MAGDIVPISLTQAARDTLAGHFGADARPVLRVFLSFMYESGPRLDVAEDQPGPGDSLFDVGGWRFAINDHLLMQAAPLTVDIGPEGFFVHSSLDFSEAGGNCGGSCDSH